MELVFLRGTTMRRVFLKGKEVVMFTPENGNVPIQIDLSKLQDNLLSIKNNKNMKNDDLDKLATLNTEEEMAQSIIDDFRSTGWRLVKDGRVN